MERHTPWARKVGRLFAAKLAELGFEGGRILDAGSGSGETAMTLAEVLPGAEVVGLDLSEPLLAMARDAADERGLAGRVSFTKGDVQAMPFDGHAFDAIVSQDTLHCVPDPVAMIRECERVLAPAGALVVRNIKRSWLGWLDAVFTTAYTAGEVKDILIRSGLRPWKLRAGLLCLHVEASPRTAAQ